MSAKFVRGKRGVELPRIPFGDECTFRPLRCGEGAIDLATRHENLAWSKPREHRRRIAASGERKAEFPGRYIGRRDTDHTR